MRTKNSIFGILKRIWEQTQSMDSWNRVASCKRGDWRLLVEDFKLKPIKEGGKILNQQVPTHLTNEIYMAQQFTTAPNLPNPYSTHMLNNMNLVKTMTNEWKDWTKKYHKIIQGIEWMVDIQLQLQNIIKLVEEANTQITEIETMVLQASDNYWTQIAEDIFSISEDLQNVVQNDMEN